MFAGKNFSRLWVWLVYTLVALLVLAPLLGRGFVLALDMVFTPKIRMPSSVGSSYLFRALLHGLNFVLPGDIIEKLVLFAVFVLAGAGMHRLFKQITDYRLRVTDSRRNQSPVTRNLLTYSLYALHSTVPALFAGIFYVINPFTYDRLMAGQYNVLFGYALLPWFVGALLKFIRSPDLRRSLVLAAWAVAVSIVSIHAIGFMALLVFAAVIAELYKRKKNAARPREFWKFGLLSLGIFLFASSYWLVPLALGHGNTAAEISGFGAADRAAFATVGGSWIGRFGNVMLLQGFWAEGRDLFNLPQDQVPEWFFLGAAIWLLVLLGGIRLWRTHRRIELAILGITGLIAAILAAGTFNNWLAAHLPLFAGYREPQKFAALVALIFAFFAGQGVAAVLQVTTDRLRVTGRKILATFYLLLSTSILLAVPFLWTPTMLWGAGSQLAPAQYPASWFAANKSLDADKGDFKVLFLPWHEYMSFDFEGRIIANPAPQFFDKPVIISNNPEFGKLAPVMNSESAAIGKILQAAINRNDLSGQLAGYHIKYIILALDDDYTNYNYVRRQPDLQLMGKSATLELYRNKSFGG